MVKTGHKASRAWHSSSKCGSYGDLVPSATVGRRSVGGLHPDPLIATDRNRPCLMLRSTHIFSQNSKASALLSLVSDAPPPAHMVARLSPRLTAPQLSFLAWFLGSFRSYLLPAFREGGKCRLLRRRVLHVQHSGGFQLSCRLPISIRANNEACTCGRHA